MTAIVPFQFETHQIRTIADDQGDPWFIAKDVAAALGYADTPKAIKAHCKHAKSLSELGWANCPPQDDQQLTIDQQTKLIPESDLYRLTLKSTLDSAERFQDWVTEEVLPTLRKTGRYQIPSEPTISPAQQRQLQNAIAERFPEGKHRPYAWSRFNNHFQLGSYKQLPAAKTDEALAYIGAMETKDSGETDRERLARETLSFSRFLLHFDQHGIMRLQEVPERAFVVTGEEMVKIVGEPGEIALDLLPGLIENAAKRLKKA